MKWSLNLGRLFGIKVLVHWTFLILIAWVVISEVNKGSNVDTILLTVAYVLTIFLCVVLHELGHALTARRFNIQTRKITLLPIGGVASLERIPEDPRKELQVAIAGPLVNFVICIILYPFINNQIMAVTSDPQMAAVITIDNFAYSIFLVNVILILFNAIPAFPMDGGRVLRALLAMKTGRLKATNIASKLGQVIAFLFFILGLFFNPFLIFIGLFVFFGAYSENAVAQQIEFLRGHNVEEAMMTNYSTLKPNDPVTEARNKLIAGSETAFAVVENDELKGIVTRKDIVHALKHGSEERPVSDIMTKNFESFTPTEKLTHVFHKIQKSSKGIFPVVKDNKIIGLIDNSNVSEFIMIQSALRY